MANLEKVKVLVVGDSGVGKTSLVNLICHNERLSSPAWTIGCSVETKVYDYKHGTPQEKEFFIELWDVGGSANHKCSRSIFYASMNGLILVHDLTNRKSYLNLRKWLAEVLGSGKEMTGVASRKSSKASLIVDFDKQDEYDPEQFAGNQVPILIVGTKSDQSGTSRTNSFVHGVNLAEEVGADSISLDCTKIQDLSDGSENLQKFNMFIDKVIERRFYLRDNSSQPQTILFQDSTRIDIWKERASKRKAF
ncbi:rab-like protein 3 [Dendronephthya gigantea]|uniref:rab-like protein 3 n=1 Tax=Dendronephthya gigantea TaxID=151771 RepID=UPI00106AD6D7|nr:rab-like protein 3 [Dendronephthya gigantea]